MSAFLRHSERVSKTNVSIVCSQRAGGSESVVDVQRKGKDFTRVHLNCVYDSGMLSIKPGILLLACFLDYSSFLWELIVVNLACGSSRMLCCSLEETWTS